MKKITGIAASLAIQGIDPSKKRRFVGFAEGQICIYSNINQERESAEKKTNPLKAG